MASTSPAPSPADSAAPLHTALGVVLLGIAALGVGLVAAPYKAFDLDRFFVPKELVLHVAALCIAFPIVRRSRRVPFTGVDVLLALYLALSVVSALFAANAWLATRALAVTWSSLLLFWSATAFTAGGPQRRRTITGLLAVAVVAVAVSALVQAYGADSTFFSTNRAPGGTLGNRNFVAHLAAIITPLLIVTAVGARRWLATAAAALGLAAVSAILVLSRTRAAWIALVACVIVLLPGVWRARRKWRVPGMRRRLALIGCVAAAAVGAAVFAPNALEWRSKSPYLDTMKNVADYKGGSGRGRLLQYENSIRLALHHPLLGVGPGNWAVAYPAIVPASDPSLDDQTRMTANPWPSSDWMAFVSERGWIATGCLALAMLMLLSDAAGQLLSATAFDDYLRGLALGGTVIATVIVGLFDAVLLLPAPALIVFAALGALRTPPVRRAVAPPAALRVALAAAVVALGVGAAARSAFMLRAMRDYEHDAVVTAAREDPGSYRIQMRLADDAAARGRCDLVRVHAGAARALFPYAPAPKRRLAECSRSAPR